MATKFNPLKFYAFNNVKVLSDPSDIVLYADSVDLRKRFEALLAEVNAGEDSSFDDLIRLITGLGFVIVPVSIIKYKSFFNSLLLFFLKSCD